MNKFIKMCLMFLFMLTGVSSMVVGASLSGGEVSALNDLAKATDVKNWKNWSNWGDGDPCQDEWYGITCNTEGSHVTHISLPYNNLTGSLPDSIGDFTSLTYLNLNSNHLTGKLPSSFLNLSSSLTGLYLYGNNFEGEITDLFLFSKLTTLDIHENNFGGGIGDIGKLENIHNLNLGSNQLRGTIPSNITYLVNMYWLDLYGNQFTGFIPVSLTTLTTTLTHVNLASNQLSGEIPSDIQNMNLDFLYLVNNCNLYSKDQTLINYIDTHFSSSYDDIINSNKCPSNHNPVTIAPIISYLLSDTGSTPPPPEKPVAPTLVQAVPVNQTSDKMTVTWDDNSNNETSFYVYRSPTVDGVKVRIATLGANTISYTDSGLVGCQNYYYWVSANNAGGSSWSDYGDGTTAPAAPTGLTASQGTTLIMVLLEWNTVSCSDSYKFYRVENGGAWLDDGTLPGGSNSASFDDGVMPGSNYLYKMTALKDGAEGSISNEALGWVNSAVPKNLTATRGEYYDGIILEWDAIQTCPDGGGLSPRYMNAYRIYYATSEGGPYTISNSFEKFVGINNDYSYTNTSPNRITETLAIPQDDTSVHYYFKMTSEFKRDDDCNGFDDDGTTYKSNIDHSTAVEGWKAPTTQADPNVYLPAPSWVNATDNKSCKIDISWATVSGAEFYRVFRASSPWGPWILEHNNVYGGSVTESCTASLHTIVWTGYWYKVVGVNTNSGGYENGNGYANDPEGGWATRWTGLESCY